MKSLRKTGCILALAVALVPTVLRASDITYTVDEIIGSGSATGTITTDGAIGLLGTSDIVDWNLILNDGSNSTFNLQGPASGNNSQDLITGSDLSASATQLVFDFSSGDGGFFLLENSMIGDTGPFICYTGDLCSMFPTAGISLATQDGESDTIGVALSDPTVIGSVDSTTPEPSSLLLFGTGLAILSGTLRRKLTRKSQLKP